MKTNDGDGRRVENINEMVTPNSKFVNKKLPRCDIIVTKPRLASISMSWNRCVKKVKLIFFGGKIMKSYFKKFMAMVLAVLMVLGSFSMSVFAADEVDADHEHTWVEWGTVPPTCTTVGYTLEKCSCGEVREKAGSIVLPTGHEEYVWDANNAVFYCPACGDVKEWNDGIVKHAYEFVAVTANPTCTTPGNVQFACYGSDNCDCTEAAPSIVNEEIAKFDHDYKLLYADVVDCNEDADYYIHYECVNCGGEYKEEILGRASHVWADDEDCKCVKTCEVCGKTVATHTPGEGVYGYEIGDPDNTLDNYCTIIYEFCVNCDCETCTDNTVVEKLENHREALTITTVIKPTCESWGTEIHFCKYCGWQDSAVPVEPIGHDYKVEVHYEATCTAPGLQVTTCNNGCDYRKIEVIPATGHDFPTITDEDAVYVEATCVSGAIWELECRNGCGERRDVIDEENNTPNPDNHPYHMDGNGEIYDPYHITTQPTCYADGVLSIACSLCNTYETWTYEEMKAAEESGRDFVRKTSEDIKKLTHEFAEENVPGTCVTPSKVVKTCALCGLVEEIVGEKNYSNHAVPGVPIEELLLNHPNVVIDGKTYFRTPTGESNGILYLECPACNTFYTKEDYGTKLEGHTLDANGDGKVDILDGVLAAEGQAPTCTDKGFTASYVCYCQADYYGSYYEYDVATKTYEWFDKKYDCPYYEIHNTDEIPALGHDYINVIDAKDATCTEAGNTAGWECSRCDAKLESIELPALGHDLVKVDATIPTCEKSGNIEYYDCSRCTYLCVYDKDGAEVEIALADTLVAATGHKFVAATADSYCSDHFQAPTCSEEGYWYGEICENENCDGGKAFFVYEDGTRKLFPVIDDKGQVIDWIDYVETTDGKACNHDIVAAYGHNTVSDTVAPTCEVAGITYVLCTNCGEAIVYNYVAPLGHNWVDTSKEATCTEGGYTASECTICGDVVDKTNETPALGHNVEYHTSEARYEICDRCNEEIDLHEGKYFVLNATGYQAILDEEGNYDTENCMQYAITVHCCVDCDARFSENADAVVLPHVFGEPEVDQENFERVYTCGCGYEMRKPIENLVFSSDVLAVRPDENGEYELLDCGVVNSGLLAVQIKVSGNDVNFWGVEMALNYDADLMTYETTLTSQYNTANNTNMFFEFKDNENGTVRIVAAHTKDVPVDRNLSGTEEFVTLFFRVNYDKYNVDAAFAIAKGAKVIKADAEKLDNCLFNEIESAHIYQLGDVMKAMDGVDIFDAQALMEMLFDGADYEAVADINKDGIVNTHDFVYLQALIADIDNYDDFFKPAE